MQPLTVDANRPKGRFCILGSEMIHVWASGCLALEKHQGRYAYRNVALGARPIGTRSCQLSARTTPIGPLWTDQAPSDSVPNRSTVDRFTFAVLRDPSASRQHWYPSIPMLFPHSLHLEPGVGALGLSAGRCEPQGSEIPDLKT